MSKTEFRASPVYRVVSTLTTKADVDAMVKELQAVGFKNDGNMIGIHHGESGKDFIDPDGSRHGFFARLTRARQRLGSWEASMLEQVDEALNAGQYVTSVLTDDSQQQRTLIRDIMKKYANRTIYYHGYYSMEILYQPQNVTNSQFSGQVMQIKPLEIKLEEAPDLLRNWQQQTEQTRQHPGFIQARLHQSIQEDPQFRFVDMARWGSAKAFSSAFGTVDKAYLYQQVVEQVGHEAEYQTHVIIINFMAVAAEAVDSLVGQWSQISETVAQTEGFISATLYQAVDPENQFQFVNYAQWDSAEAHRKFRQQLTAISDKVTIHSGMYQAALVSTQ